jgi:hypothetical protein
MTALLDLRAALSDLLGDYLGTYTLANGATTPAIAVRAIGEARKTGTTVSGMELIIERDPDTIQVQTQGQSPSVLEWTVWLVSWDESSLAAPAARLVAAFPNVEAEPVRVPEGSGPSNQIRVSLQIGQTLVVSGPPSGVTVTGTSSAALVILGSAAGFVGTVSIGTSSGTLITTGSAAGVVTVTAVSSQSLAFGGSASGGVRVGGASSQTLAITGTAAGLVGAGASATGNSSATLAITGTATGTVRVAGASTQTLEITGSTAGAVRITGSTAQTLAITGTAAGVIGAVAIGNSSATLAITGTAAGTVRVAGASAQSLAITGTAVGTVRVTGSTSQALAITGTAAGAISALAIGNSSATLAVTGTAAGTVRVAAASAQVLAITGTSAGTVRVTGSTSQTLAITGTAAGSLGGGRIGASSATLTITGTAAGVTAPLWTPAYLPGLYSWHEAWDAGTIAVDGSQRVTQWDDKSGAGRHYTQGNTANMATYDSGKKSLTRTTTGGSMSMSNDSANQPTAITIAYLIDVLAGAEAASNVVMAKGDIPFDAPGFYVTDNAAAAAWNGTSTILLTQSSWSSLQCTVHRWGASGGTSFSNGVQNGAGATTASAFSPRSTALARRIMRWQVASASAPDFLGDFYCIIESSQVVSDADRERLEGYMAHGSGKTQLLPEGHPYKLVPPTRLTGYSAQTLAITGTAAGVVQEAIVAENARTGVADSTVGVSSIGRGTDGFLGYAKQFSTNAGNSVSFAVDGTNAANIAIHRIGHYAGNRWRLVATISNTGTNQPDVQTLANSNGSTSASNWSTTATWSIPADAVSGLYVGVVRNSGNTAQAWIPFIVRNDSRTADIVIRVSDTTWGAAYNAHGTKAAPFNGKTVYGQGYGGSLFDINLRGVQMSYDRPITSRGPAGGDSVVNHWDNHESALIDWVEKNGFNVKYISCYDLDQGLTAVGSAKVLLNAGHDEYWSDGMINNTEAFIDGGGHAVSMSANTQFWRIRWADGGRTFWCYKDTMPGPTGLRTGGAGTALDPVSWTGTWRDTRWGSRRPENLLLAGTFRMNGIRDETMVINGAANQAKPFWRNTTVASGTTLTVTQVIGFEADSLDFPNAGGVNLGATTININGSYADDNGENYIGNGTLNWGIACHYPRLGSTAGLAFSFCTNQWMWGLSNYHRRGSAVNNREMRQATYNLLTDLGSTAATKESDLTTVTPVALSTYGAVKVNTGSSIQGLAITGTAAGTVRVTGSSSQSISITGTAAGTTGGGSTLYQLSPNGTVGADTADALDLGPYELGTRFTVSGACDCYSIKFRRPTTNAVAGTPLAARTWTVRLWNADTSTQIGTATVSSGAGAAGVWLEAVFSSPIALSTGVTYLASYTSPASTGYNATSGFFASAVTPGSPNPLTGPINAGRFNTTQGAFPASSFNNAYYYVQPVVAVGGPVLPSVSVAVSPSSTAEDGAGNLVFTFTRTNTVGALAVNYSIGGTATNGTDYATIASPVNFIDGNATATVTVDPTTDATSEANETVILTVTSDSGYNVGSPSVATGTINNDDGGGGAGVFQALGTQSDSEATSVTSGTSTLATVNAGDLVIAIIQRQFQPSCTGVTLGGAAMTLLRRNYAGAPNEFGVDVWGIIAASGGTSVNVVASYSNSWPYRIITTARYSGVSSATPLASTCNGASCNSVASSSTNRLAQSITVAQPALLLAVGTDYNLLSTHTPTSGWTKRLDGSGTPLSSYQFLHDQNVVAGTYGGATAFATSSQNDTYFSILIAFPLS